MVEKVKIFIDTTEDGNSLEKKVNEWLSENSEKIAIVNRKMSISQGNQTHPRCCITIFYTDKH